MAQDAFRACFALKRACILASPSEVPSCQVPNHILFVPQRYGGLVIEPGYPGTVRFSGKIK